MCGYIWVFHCWQGSSREPIRENDPLDRQSLYTGTKFMPVYKAKGMPKGCCGKSFRFQWVGYDNFRLSNPTAIFPLIAAVLSSKTEKIFTSVETIRRINGSYTALLSLISWSRRSGLNRRPADYETRREPSPRKGFNVLRWTGSANICPVTTMECEPGANGFSASSRWMYDIRILLGVLPGSVSRLQGLNSEPYPADESTRPYIDY